MAGTFYSALPDGEYRISDLPHPKDRWEQGLSLEFPLHEDETGPDQPVAQSPSAPLMQTHDISVIVRSGKLVGVRVGDGEPITDFARSRDVEFKWTDGQG